MKLKTLVALMKLHGYDTQEKRARALGLKRGTIGVLEAGFEKTYPKFRRKCAELLEMPEALIFPELERDGHD